HDRSVPLAGADVADALAAPPLFAVAHGRGGFAAGFGFRGLLGRLLRRFLRLGLGRFLAGDVGAERRPLAVAVFAHGQQVPLRVGHDHADDLVALAQVDAPDAAGVAAHGPGLGFVEPDRHALAGTEHDLVARLRQGHTDQRVALVQVDADDAS